MSDNAQLTENAFIHFHNLTTLTMSSCPTINMEAFRHLESISELDITGGYNYTDDLFIIHVPHRHTLQKLNISKCTKLTNRSFQYFTRLHTLDMSECSQNSVSNKAFTYLS